jgi:hypothetical protein
MTVDQFNVKRIHALKAEDNAAQRSRSAGLGLTNGQLLTANYWFSGGRYRIRTYDFHRVKMALYR